MPWTNVSDLVRAKARQHGDHLFAVVDGRELNYRQLDTISDNVAANLVQVGIVLCDCVASLLANCAEQLFGWIGVAARNDARFDAQSRPISDAR